MTLIHCSPNLEGWKRDFRAVSHSEMQQATSVICGQFLFTNSICVNFSDLSLPSLGTMGLLYFFLTSNISNASFDPKVRQMFTHSVGMMRIPAMTSFKVRLRLDVFMLVDLMGSMFYKHPYANSPTDVPTVLTEARMINYTLHQKNFSHLSRHILDIPEFLWLPAVKTLKPSSVYCTKDGTNISSSGHTMAHNLFTRNTLVDLLLQRPPNMNLHSRPATSSFGFLPFEN